MNALTLRAGHNKSEHMQNVYTQTRVKGAPRILHWRRASLKS